VLVAPAQLADVLEYARERAAVIRVLADACGRGDDDHHEVRMVDDGLQAERRSQLGTGTQQRDDIGLVALQRLVVDGVDVCWEDIAPQHVVPRPLKRQRLAQTQASQADDADAVAVVPWAALRHVARSWRSSVGLLNSCPGKR